MRLLWQEPHRLVALAPVVDTIDGSRSLAARSEALFLQEPLLLRERAGLALDSAALAFQADLLIGQPLLLVREDRTLPLELEVLLLQERTLVLERENLLRNATVHDPRLRPRQLLVQPGGVGHAEP